MGSKVPGVAKVKRQGLNCEDCSAKFPNLTILKRHRLKVHKKTRANKVTASKGDKQALSGSKKLDKIKTIKKVANPKKDIEKYDTERKLPEQDDSQCHVCRKLFPTRSEMLDHYKMTHLRSSDNVKTKVDVALNKLMHTVKKVTQDHSKCVTCSKIFATRRSMLLHVCQSSDQSKEQYRCAGCKKKFDSLERLDAHIVTDHDDNIEILVFKDEDEFQAWKKKEELTTKINYIKMSCAGKSSKVYRCSAGIKNDTKGTVKNICPAAIMLRTNKDFLKATFYKSHHGHSYEEYAPKDFKQGTKSNAETENTKLSVSSNMESSVDLDNKDTESDDAFESDLKLYRCLACDQTYNSMKQLNYHLNGAHNDDIYSILFPNNEEFETWRAKMQTMTNTTYAPGIKHDQKMYYNCDAPFKTTTHIDENGLEWVTKRVCPSTIVSKQYDRGLQIHFYKRHYDHEHTEYVPTNEIRKYDIKSMFSHNTKRKNIHTPEYKKLKNMLIEVLSIAENLPASNLKTLVNEANGISQKAKTLLEKNHKINSENEPNNTPAKEKITYNAVKRKLGTDDTNKDKSEELRTSKRLRGRPSKEEMPSVKPIPVKNVMKKAAHRTKSPSITTNIPIIVAPKIVNTFTLATDFKDIEDISSANLEPDMNGVEREENTEIERKSVQEEPLQQITANPRKKYEDLLTTSTFNDSYKTFIESSTWGAKLEKNNPDQGNLTETPKPEPQQTVKKKHVRMKTKLGQYSPKNRLPKTPIKSTSPVKPLSTSMLDKSHTTQLPRKHSSTLASGKSPSVPVLGKSRSTPKIGRSISTPILGKFKVEKYEVKEQENDCNILILKI